MTATVSTYKTLCVIVPRMKTAHKVFYSDSSNMASVDSNSVGLIITSPPYPMVEMWDGIFSQQSTSVHKHLAGLDGYAAYTEMHEVLKKVWLESYRVLQDGCFLCINIGDATRKVGDNFRLYTNHSRITEICEAIGFESLPAIIWRKQTNAPNKFMGSGMLPSGAYVTLEHEYILVFRKKSKREFSGTMKDLRRESAFFWEERNIWFSDLWDFKGARQTIVKSGTRERSGAFPFELAYRLINMYSLLGETVLDPFMGTGTTALAAMCAGRSSLGFEIDNNLVNYHDFCANSVKYILNNIVKERLNSHIKFIVEYMERKGETKNYNDTYNFHVVTAQENDLILHKIESIKMDGNSIDVSHSKLLISDLVADSLF